jgi:hypothetical protein
VRIQEAELDLPITAKERLVEKPLRLNPGLTTQHANFRQRISKIDVPNPVKQMCSMLMLIDSILG